MKSGPTRKNKNLSRQSDQEDGLAFTQHDHSQCQQQTLSLAKEHCRVNKLRLTPRRLQVLEIILRSHQPLGAYEILAQMDSSGPGEKLAPPMVYRALEFLQTQKLIHRLESKNAYIGCHHPGHTREAQFLICRDCDRVAELSVSDASIKNQASQIGFAVDHSVIEISGLCSNCQQTDQSRDGESSE